MVDESGSLVLKVRHSTSLKNRHCRTSADGQPALPREIAFYHLLSSSDKSDPIHQLKPFVPLFYGTWGILGQTSGSGVVEPVVGAPPEVSRRCPTVAET